MSEENAGAPFISMGVGIAVTGVGLAMAYIAPLCYQYSQNEHYALALGLGGLVVCLTGCVIAVKVANRDFRS